MFKLTALDRKRLEQTRDARSDELYETHRKVHELICDNQDDSCTVSEEIALQVLELIMKFAVVTRNPESSEVLAVSLLNDTKEDAVWCSIYTYPEPNDRYYVTSASDYASSIL